MCHGANLIPENLESGESIVQSSFSSYDFEPAYIMAYSGDFIGQQGFPINQDGATYNGMFSSVNFILCNKGGFTDLLSMMIDNQADYIVSCFTVPILAVKSVYVPDLPQHDVLANNTETPVEYSVATRPSSLDGYTPRNKKLLQFPFCYLGFNKTNSSAKVYRFEDFTNGTAVFTGISEVNPNPQVVLTPKNYKGLTDNYDESAYLGGYPTISYKTDTFNSWLAQNSNIINLEKSEKRYNLNMDYLSQGLGYVTDARQCYSFSFKSS